jgi:hypothetical protein
MFHHTKNQPTVEVRSRQTQHQTHENHHTNCNYLHSFVKNEKSKLQNKEKNNTLVQMMSNKHMYLFLYYL